MTLVACGAGGQGAREREAGEAAAAATGPPPPVGAVLLRVETPTARRQVVVTSGPYGMEVDLADSGGRLLVRGYPRGNHRRYEEDGRPLAKARTLGSSILVTSPQDAYLYQVSMPGRQVRIGVGRADSRPYVLALSRRGQVLVRRGDQRLGRAVLERGRVKVRGADGAVRYVARDSRLRPLYGVLLLAEVPAAHRAVLLAELLRAEQ
jgi:hypothetical protein